MSISKPRQGFPELRLTSTDLARGGIEGICVRSARRILVSDRASSASVRCFQVKHPDQRISRGAALEPAPRIWFSLERVECFWLKFRFIQEHLTSPKSPLVMHAHLVACPCLAARKNLMVGLCRGKPSWKRRSIFGADRDEIAVEKRWRGPRREKGSIGIGRIINVIKEDIVGSILVSKSGR